MDSNHGEGPHPAQARPLKYLDNNSKSTTTGYVGKGVVATNKRAPTAAEIVATSWVAIVPPPDAPVLGLDELIASEAKLSAAMVGPDTPPEDVWKFVQHESDRRRYLVLTFRRKADRFEHVESNPRAACAGTLDDRGTDALFDRLAARAFELKYMQRKTRQYQGQAHVWRFDPLAREIWIASSFGAGTDVVYVEVAPGEDVLARHTFQIVAILRRGRGVVLRFEDSAASRAVANQIDRIVAKVSP